MLNPRQMQLESMVRLQRGGYRGPRIRFLRFGLGRRVLAKRFSTSEMQIYLDWQQGTNPHIDPLTRCLHHLSHGRLKPILLLWRTCPDAAACAFGDVVMKYALPW